VSTEPAVAGGPRVAIRRVWGPPRLRGDKLRKFVRTYRLDIAWAVFIVLNLLAMRLIPAWQTVPFLIIWISLTTIYGFRLWHLGSTMLTVAVVTLSTGGLIGWQVLRGKQDGDYLAEVPLLAAMFIVMVWHARRRQTALEEMKRVSERNLQLLSQQRQFLQDVSHELARRSPSLSATPSSSPTPPPTRPSPRTPGWPWTNCSGCAGWPTAWCSWPRRTARTSCTWPPWTPRRW
jgi:signal transduction histidine kinase